MKFQRGFHIIVLVITLVSATSLSNAQTYIKPVTAHIHPLRPKAGLAGRPVSGLNCLSWRLAVETDNLRSWNTVPTQCEGYVGNYMMGAQYKKDCFAVTSIAYDYIKNFTLNKNGKDIWVFDLDETSLSNLPYYARPEVGFGAVAYNSTAFNEWVAEGKAPAIPAVLHLYQKLLRLGVKIVFITGTSSTYRKIREQNMRNIGYHTWEMMIFKEASESNLTALEYKSKHRTELEKIGYRIIGNIGDQWSDILGPHPGLRTFKIPDPLYYIA